MSDEKQPHGADYWYVTDYHPESQRYTVVDGTDGPYLSVYYYRNKAAGRDKARQIAQQVADLLNGNYEAEATKAAVAEGERREHECSVRYHVLKQAHEALKDEVAEDFRSMRSYLKPQGAETIADAAIRLRREAGERQALLETLATVTRHRDSAHAEVVRLRASLKESVSSYEHELMLARQAQQVLEHRIAVGKAKHEDEPTVEARGLVQIMHALGSELAVTQGVVRDLTAELRDHSRQGTSQAAVDRLLSEVADAKALAEGALNIQDQLEKELLVVREELRTLATDARALAGVTAAVPASEAIRRLADLRDEAQAGARHLRRYLDDAQAEFKKQGLELERLKRGAPTTDNVAPNQPDLDAYKIRIETLEGMVRRAARDSDPKVAHTLLEELAVLQKRGL